MTLLIYFLLLAICKQIGVINSASEVNSLFLLGLIVWVGHLANGKNNSL